MWNIPNYFLANLALADLGMAVLNCIPSFLFMRDGYEIFNLPPYLSIIFIPNCNSYILR
jgi:hypothetical protein